MAELKHSFKADHFGSHFKDLHEQSGTAHKILLEKEGMPHSIENIVRFYAEKRPKMFEYYIRQMATKKEIKSLANLIVFFRGGNEEHKKISLEIFKIVARHNREIAEELIKEINGINQGLSKPTSPKPSKAPEEPKKGTTPHPVGPLKADKGRPDKETIKPVAEIKAPERPKPKSGPERNKRKAEIKTTIIEIHRRYGLTPFNTLDRAVSILEQIEYNTGGKIDLEKLTIRDVTTGLQFLIMRNEEHILDIAGKTKVNDVSYTLGNIYNQKGNQRKYVCCYTTKNGETKITIYYKSGSSDNWRLLPLTGDADSPGHFYKSEAGEEFINAPWQIQRILDSKPSISVEDDVSEEFTLLSPEQDKIWSKGGVKSRKIAGNREKLKIDTSIKFPGWNTLDITRQENLPDFSKVVAVWPAQSELYGTVKKVSILSKSGSYTWTFSSCAEGVFFSGIEVTNGDISKHGLPQIPAIHDPKGLHYLLITQPREYQGQLFRRLIRAEAKYRKQGKSEAADRIKKILAVYGSNVDPKDIKFGYENVMKILLMHPFIKAIQEPIRKITGH